MARKTTPASFTDLINTARAAIPQVAITTDIIVGFPGETQAEFEQSLEYVKAMNFSGGHVFTYSERPGTAASRMPDQIAHSERKARNARMQATLLKTEIAYQQAFVGMEMQVLWESAKTHGRHGWKISGLTDNYMRVHSYARTQHWNRITPVKLTALTQKGLVGKIIE